MVDGLVVLLVGLGVVFAFLVLLMGLIKILNLRKARPHSYSCLERVSNQTQPAGKAGALTPADASDDGQGRRRAALVAVALCLSARRPPRPCAFSPEASAWRSAGRADLMKPLENRR